MDRFMRRWLAAVALLLIGSLSALTPLAQAIPQDPTWIAGIYDGADYDDVALLITTAGGIAPSVSPQVFPGVAVEAMPAQAGGLVSTAPPSPLQSRAPPA
jgi:hypothetical protein